MSPDELLRSVPEDWSLSGGAQYAAAGPEVPATWAVSVGACGPVRISYLIGHRPGHPGKPYLFHAEITEDMRGDLAQTSLQTGALREDQTRAEWQTSDQHGWWALRGHGRQRYHRLSLSGMHGSWAVRATLLTLVPDEIWRRIEAHTEEWMEQFNETNTDPTGPTFTETFR
ncbi:hypothetical protein [Actinocorallia longicatena]|uniref:SRPBCC family protein n=1 Tax=Actinocorallia longicatena TaxID=111803 RepID=A0ABP6QKK4_9ACTN